MCKYCLPILGQYCKSHTEDACPLKKAMYCSLCGKGKHSTTECSLKPTISQKKVIPSEKIVYTEKIYYMAHTNAGYIEYLQKHSIDFSSSIDGNHILVAKSLLESGYVLQNPIEKKKKIIIQRKNAPIEKEIASS